MQFVFDDEGLEVLIKSKDDKAEESENKFVGGQNRWSYDAFTNWEFWWKKFPVLVYFKVCSFNTSYGLWHHCCHTFFTTMIQNSKWVCMGTQNARSMALSSMNQGCHGATTAHLLTCSIMTNDNRLSMQDSWASWLSSCFSVSVQLRTADSTFKSSV